MMKTCKLNLPNFITTNLLIASLSLVSTGCSNHDEKKESTKTSIAEKKPNWHPL